MLYKALVVRESSPNIYKDYFENAPNNIKEKFLYI